MKTDNATQRKPYVPAMYIRRKPSNKQSTFQANNHRKFQPINESALASVLGRSYTVFPSRKMISDQTPAKLLQRNVMDEWQHLMITSRSVSTSTGGVCLHKFVLTETLTIPVVGVDVSGTPFFADAANKQICYCEPNTPFSTTKKKTFKVWSPPPPPDISGRNLHEEEKQHCCCRDGRDETRMVWMLHL